MNHPVKLPMDTTAREPSKVLKVIAEMGTLLATIVVAAVVEKSVKMLLLLGIGVVPSSDQMNM